MSENNRRGTTTRILQLSRIPIGNDYLGRVSVSLSLPYRSDIAFDIQIDWHIKLFVFRYDPETNPDAKSLLLKKINLIFGDEVDETIVSGEDSVASTPESESGSSIGEKSDNVTGAEKKAASKKASRKERFRKMKDTLVDAIWNQSECLNWFLDRNFTLRAYSLRKL